MLPHYDIIYTALAKQDLTDIKRHYIIDLDDAYSGAKMVYEIVNHIEKLNIFPERGEAVSTISGIKVRMTHWKRFNIYYQVIHSPRQVQIITIINAHRRYRPF